MARLRFCSCGLILDGDSVCNCKKRITTNAEKERNREFGTVKWKKFRKSIIKRDGEVCVRCIVKFNFVVSDRLEVHHIVPRITNPELMYEPSNCITVCKRCNLELGTKGKLDFKYDNGTINDNGDTWCL